jgi:ssDNA-binding Zn-finger/Zn-ribbon topoisomerase 1
MARGTGAVCPNCGQRKFHDEGSYRQCSGCNYVGWSWNQPVRDVGKGSGVKCPNCGNQTLHVILELQHGQRVRRCRVCDFSAIEPATL